MLIEHVWHETAEWESLRRGGGRLPRLENARRTGDAAGDFGLEYCSGSMSGAVGFSSGNGQPIIAERRGWEPTVEIEVVVVVERRRRDAVVQRAPRDGE